MTCGLPWPTVIYTILINEIMIVTGLIGALVHSSYKWGYFVFGCLAFLFVAWTVVFEGRSYARIIGNDVNRAYTLCGVWTISLWFLYPIAWGLSEGGNVIASDSEAVFYGILDILAKPGFGALLLWGHRNIDIKRLGLDIRDIHETGAFTSDEKHDNHYTNNGNTSIDNGYQAGSNGYQGGNNGVGTNGVTGNGITGNDMNMTGVTPVHNTATTSNGV